MQQSVELQAKDIDVCRKSRLILHNVSFSVKPGTLTAIIGPNGAGKTTLMRALSGERPDRGQVLINGDELYAKPEYWLRRIGYVPVDNILHDHLTVHEALMYIGRLRLPHSSEEEIAARVDSLLTEFDFKPEDGRRNQMIHSLSSGERKRANVCSELIIDPPLLMLDEPTSNLDPDAERNLMHLLADYAHNNGQTILVITHTLNTIDVCDEVIFIENSQLKAAGSREDVLGSLEAEIGDVDTTASSFYRWAEVFEHYKTREDRLPCQEGKMLERPDTDSQSDLEIDQVPWGDQFRHLLSRYMKVRIGDRWSLIGTLVAGFSGIMFFILPGKTFVKPYDPAEISLALNQARQSIYLVALVVTLIGLITSYTEISKEYRIFKHERLKGLSPSAYFASKWVWLTAGVGIWAPIVLIAFIVMIYRQPLPGFPEPRFGEEVTLWGQIIRFQLVGLLTAKASWLILTTLVLACITSVTLGLCISALAGDSDRGYLYLSFVVVFIVLFSGLIQNQKLEQLVDTLSFASTGKWAYEGVAASIGIYCWQDSWRFDEYNSTGHLLSIWFALGAFTLTAASLAVIVLRLRDPWYGRAKNMLRLLSQEKKWVSLGLSLLLVCLSYAFFLRQGSFAYHTLNYWSRQEYGGTNAYVFANISQVENPSTPQRWNGELSQSWCGEQ